MINGEGAEEKPTSAVASSYDRESDGGDQLSHYSCGERFEVAIKLRLGGILADTNSTNIVKLDARFENAKGEKGCLLQSIKSVICLNSLIRYSCFNQSKVAFLLLCEIEPILELLKHHEPPSLDHGKQHILKIGVLSFGKIKVIDCPV